MDIEWFELSLTRRCSLQCLECSHLMQYYGINGNKPATDTPLEVLQSSIQNIIKCIDSVGHITILGGEPLLYKQLPKLLEFLLQQPKIGGFLLITNGTIIPKDSRLIQLLQNPKITISISFYGKEISIKTKEFEKFAKDNDIKLNISKDRIWKTLGNMECRNRSTQELDEQFKKCASGMNVLESLIMNFISVLVQEMRLIWVL